MKRTSALIALGLTTALALTACGRADADDPASSDPTVVGDGAATGTLEVWAMGTEGELLPQLAEKFAAENPGLKVNVTPVPWDSASQKITTAITSGTTPDMVQVGTTWMSGFVDMDGFAATPSDIDKSVFFPGAWDTTVVNGTSYAVPWYVETRVLFYRSDLAAQAGVTSPTDWEGLKKFTGGMQTAGAQYGISLQTSGQDTTNMWLPFFWQAGGSILSDDGKTFELDSDAAAKSVDFYASFMKEGIAPQVATDDDKMQNFVSGKLGSFVSGPWDVQNAMTVANDPAFADKFAVTALPPDVEPASFIGGSNLAVFKDAKNPTAAWKFVQYLSDPATQIEWYGISSDLPSVESAWTDKALTADKNLQVFGDALKTAKSVPAIPTWSEVSAKLDRILEEAVAGKIDGAEAAKQMQAAAAAVGTGKS